MKQSPGIYKAYLPGMTTDGTAGGEIAVPLEVLARRLGRRPDEILRLDSDENPYGPSLRVLEVLGSAESLHRPGDPEARDLRAALELYAGCPRERITVGAGPGESLERLLRVLARPGQAIVVPTPTRPLYAAGAARLGLRVIAVPLTRTFDLNMPAMLAAARADDVALVVVATPNDPTGVAVPPAEIVRLLCAEVPVLVDESLHEFAARFKAAERAMPLVSEVVPLIGEFDNLVVLRDFATWAGLGGVPVSYLLSARPLAERLRAAAVFGGVTTAPGRAAQLAALAALQDLPLLRTHLKALRLERSRMFRNLRKLNLLQPLPSDAHFLLCILSRGTAPAIRDHLADHDGIIVRAITTPALPNHLRISVGRPQDTDALLRGLLRIAEQHPL